MQLFRRGIVAAAVSLLVAGLVAPASAAPVPVPDKLRGYSILPPGQNGYFNLADVISETLPANAGDQAEMYASLVDDDDVTDEELGSYFKPFQFGPVGAVAREYDPTDGVTVYRDTFGVPHIYAATDAAASFALGYVTAEDRLWQMDLLRHAAHGELAAFLGPDYVATDKELRRDAYTDAELQQMVDQLDDRFGSTGLAVQEALADYADGVNARIAEVKADFALFPAEYGSRPIENWSPIDTVAVVVLQLRSFGETGGAELRNAAAYEDLRNRLGKRLGKKVFSDLLREAGNAPTTIPASEGAFPSQDTGPVDPAAVAIPDDVGKLVTKFDRRARLVSRALRTVTVRRRASNFIAVAPSMSANGNTLQFGAPQVGYSIPSFFMEIDVHSPSLDFRGPAVPGASLLVPLGRGIDYAWSLTTGSSDVVDVRIEDMCGKDSYVYKGKCTKMQVRTETIEVRGGEPVTHKVRRTVHGPVEMTATVDGEPVAIVRQRSFWGEELSSVPFFYDINSNAMSSVEEFHAAAEDFSMSFNAIYSDADDIGYFHAGRFPMRAQGVDPMLPSWGTGRWEWKGMVPFAELPQVVNPEQGWLVNWNNQPATGWENGDDTFWGPAHRVQMMIDEMRRRTEGGTKLTLSDVVDVIRVVATQDGRALSIGDEMLELVGESAEADIVAAWIGAGAHRKDENRDDLQDSGPAVALFDEWFEQTVHAVFDDELGDSYRYLADNLGDEPAANNGSSFYGGFQNYLARVFAGSKGLARDYCDNRQTDAKESCKKTVSRAFTKAISTLRKSQGASAAAWTAPADHISFDEMGALGIEPLPWQNRGTWNHAVEVLGRR